MGVAACAMLRALIRVLLPVATLGQFSTCGEVRNYYKAQACCGAPRASSVSSPGGVLRVASHFDPQTNPAAHTAFESAIDAFKLANPGISLNLTTFDHEEYKTGFSALLEHGEWDVMTWAAGQGRLGPFTSHLADLSYLWSESFDSVMQTTKSAVTVDGKQLAVPFSFYYWAMYYRPDLLAEAGWSSTGPQTFDQLIDLCSSLRAVGKVPVSIGTKYFWTTLAWFDFLNMRTNGFA